MMNYLDHWIIIVWASKWVSSFFFFATNYIDGQARGAHFAYLKNSEHVWPLFYGLQGRNIALEAQEEKWKKCEGGILTYKFFFYQENYCFHHPVKRGFSLCVRGTLFT